MTIQTYSPAPRPLPSSASASGDAAFAHRLIANEGAAWNTFHACHSATLKATIRGVLGRFSRVVPSDAVDEVYSLFWLDLLHRDHHKLRCYDPSRGMSLVGWTRLLATRTAYDYLRHSRRTPVQAGVVETESLHAHEALPDETACHRQEVAQVLRLVRELSNRDQQFVELFYGEELSAEAVAEQLGIHSTTVYTKNHKIRAKLTARLAEAA